MSYTTKVMHAVFVGALLACALAADATAWFVGFGLGLLSWGCTWLAVRDQL